MNLTLIAILLFLVGVLVYRQYFIKKWSNTLSYKPSKDEIILINKLELTKFSKDEIVQILNKLKLKELSKSEIYKMINDKKQTLKLQEKDKLRKKHEKIDLEFETKTEKIKEKERELKSSIEAKKQTLAALKRNTDEVLEAEIVQNYPYNTPIEIIEYYEIRDFDAMRFALQKIAYEMVGDRHTKQEKDDFKKIMTFFAYKDPLYNDCIKKIISIVAKNEGILQTQIYSYFSEYDKETMRYVLYFANELGDIHRVKSGRSYKLHTNI